jgi:hypothetical protein
MAHIRDEVHPQPVSKKPSRKVTSAALAGAVVTIGVYAGEQFNIQLPAEVSAAAVTVLSFVASYLVRD